MSLAPGERLGPYEILAPIGAGGMGEVYKARDTRLNRFVAIKTSKQQFTERFEREARAVAALNHPNVCTLHDVGSNYLVMEFVEGAPPAGPLPLDEVLRLGRQIASALEAAHEKNITHRDLKPGNIMVKPDGSVKVLDFGLAKHTPAQAQVPGDNSPTLTMGMSEVGMILGTAFYMAPEQAKGKEVDKRADIWAFGVVLYELTTGKKPFTGDDLGDILAAVIKEQPSYEEVPVELRRMIKKCLEKDASKRLRDIGDVWELLESGAGSQPAAASQAAPTSSKLPWLVAAAMALAAAATLFTLWPQPPARSIPMRFTVALPEGQQLPTPGVASPMTSVSPDGRYLAFVAQSGAGLSLWIRGLGSLSAQRLDQTEGALFPFWSPDAQSIGFFADGKLKRIPISGGSPQTLADAPAPEGGAWFQEAGGPGIIVFTPSSSGPIHRVSDSGGISVPVTKLGEGEILHLFPQFLPDGQRILYLLRGTLPARSGIYVQSLNGDPSDKRLLVDTLSRAVYASPGFLLYVRETTLVAQKLDPASLELQGEPVPVAENVNAASSNGRAAFAVSENGVITYRSGASANQQMVSYTRDGKRTELAAEPGQYVQIMLSPDEARLVTSRRIGNGTQDLWTLEIASGILSRLTFGDADEVDPVWSPDSRRVMFEARGKEKREFREVTVGAGTETTIYAGSEPLDDWTRDGTLLVSHTNAKGVSTLALSAEKGERKLQLVFPSPFNVDEVRISPDVQWAAYGSNESGQFEVYVARFPAFTDRRQISTGGGMQPQWRADGRELFYLSPDGKMMAAEIRPGATLQMGMPRALFQTAIPTVANTHHFGVTRDGQRFYGVEPQSTAGAEPMYVIANWPALLP